MVLSRLETNTSDTMPASKGNDFAKGNAGGGAPLENQNAMKHGLFSQPDNLLNYLEREESENYQWVQAKFESYLEDAPFEDGTAKTDKLLEVCVLEYAVWRARGIQVRNGIVEKTHTKSNDGELIEINVERSENQPVNRIDRQVMSKLKNLDILDDPDHD